MKEFFTGWIILAFALMVVFELGKEAAEPEIIEEEKEVEVVEIKTKEPVFPTQCDSALTLGNRTRLIEQENYSKYQFLLRDCYMEVEKEYEEIELENRNEVRTVAPAPDGIDTEDEAYWIAVEECEADGGPTEYCEDEGWTEYE